MKINGLLAAKSLHITIEGAIPNGVAAANKDMAVPNHSRQYVALLPLVCLTAIVGCDGGTHSPNVQPLKTPSAVVEGSTATVELRPGEKFFRVGGVPRFLLGRNPVGVSPEVFDEHFAHAAAAGERLMRIHFTYMPPGEIAGEIYPDGIKFLDHLFESAAKNGLAVLPVLGVWADWNDGSGNETWHTWDKNPFNAANGGPGRSPMDLLRDTDCRKLWLKRIQFFVERWGKYRNIVAWEIFSELNLITGSDEKEAVAFTKALADAVRRADPQKRPITVSLAANNEWPELSKSNSVDFIQVHPYAAGNARGDLDVLILHVVREQLSRYGKPVLLGECGLDWRPPRETLDASPRAETGIRHAVWASVVSGAMCGRMLWWQDGYDQFEKADLISHYQDIATTAARFTKDVDFTGFVPVSCEPAANLVGGVLGNDVRMVGWFRDAECTAPDWPVRSLENTIVTVPVTWAEWVIDFFDPLSGKTIASMRVNAVNGRIHVSLPTFQGSVAIKFSADRQ